MSGKRKQNDGKRTRFSKDGDPVVPTENIVLGDGESAPKPRKYRFLKKHARRLIRLGQKALSKKNRDGIYKVEDPDQRDKIERRSVRVRNYFKIEKSEVDVEEFDYNVRKLEKALIVNAIWKPKSFWREILEAFAVAALIAFFVRSFIAEPFKIPTGSMIPTLEVGDYIFVTKFRYGLRVPFTEKRFVSFSNPQKGDVVVFDFPVSEDPDYGKNFIKRVIGAPGDRVRMVNHRLIINDNPVHTVLLEQAVPCEPDNSHSFCKCDIQEEHLGGTIYRSQHNSAGQFHCPTDPNWPSFHKPCRGELQPDGSCMIPDGEYLCMGDNRDNSRDGREWGTVPSRKIKGKAWIIWWARNKSRLFSSVHATGSDGGTAHASEKRANPTAP